VDPLCASDRNHIHRRLIVAELAQD